MLGGWGGGAGLYLGGFQFCLTKTKHNPKQTKNHHCSLRGLGAGTVAKGGGVGGGQEIREAWGTFPRPHQTREGRESFFR